jgi:DNA integrity scanning protein DisA with diadenylate cyclase activity
LFGVVDGISSSFVVSKSGNLKDVGLLWTRLEARFNSSDLIAPRYIPHAYVTKTISDSLAIFSFGKLRVVKLFEGGSLVAEASFSWKEGRWIFRSFNEIKDMLQRLADEKDISFDVLCKCLSLAVEMSNRRLGGTFIIGDSETVLEQSENPIFRFKNANLLDFDYEKEDYIINLASKDFATILDAKGTIYGSSTRLLAKPPQDTSVEILSSDGGRHRSAAEMSATARRSIAIVISEDSPITIYSNGRRIIRL